ncbi:MAG: DMT family transporter, partial [Muribaculaceae bacterium]|nr:DMT family transporter [Muribaculaceae bacterium]
IAVKALVPRYSSFFITRKLFFYGVLTALPLLFFSHEPLHIAVLFDFSNPGIFFNFMFLVIFCSLLAYIVWNNVMNVLGPVATNNYLYLQPLVTMIAAYFVFDEKIFTLGYIGCVLILGGLIIADKLEIKKRIRS